MTTNLATQLPLDLGHRAALGRTDFLISPANEEAVGWLDRWPNWPAPALVLTGPAASGKSHLGAVWQEKTQAQKIEPTDLTTKSAEELANNGQNLLIDALDPWIGDRAAETTLFHLYNMFREERRTLLLTMRAAPAQIDFAIPDLASRLRAAPTAIIHPPDDTLLAAVLVKLFSDRQLQVSEELIRYILPRMERAFAAATNLVARADEQALAQKRGISIPLLRDILAEH